MVKDHLQNNYEREIQLLIECSQTNLTETSKKNIINILNQNPDWKYLILVAQKNAILSLVGWNLTKHFDEFLTAETKRDLNKYVWDYTRHNMFLTEQLIKIVKLFEAENIATLPIKGPVLAIQFYKNLSLRIFGDLDILVKIDDLPKALDLLTEQGYEPINQISWFEKRNIGITRKKDIKFINKNNGAIVELHWKLSGSHFALPIELERLWHNLKKIKLAGRDINTLPFNSLLIYLCLHGGRHGWERLSWICDINELINSTDQKIDWDELYLEAKRLGCENTLILGLYLAQKFFPQEIHLKDWERLQQEPKLQLIYEKTKLKLFQTTESAWEINDRYLYHLMLKEKPFDKLKLHLHYSIWYLKILVLPNELDRAVVNLPKLLSPLYYIIRPLRLTFDYLKKQKSCYL